MGAAEEAKGRMAWGCGGMLREHMLPVARPREASQGELRAEACNTHTQTPLAPSTSSCCQPRPGPGLDRNILLGRATAWWGPVVQPDSSHSA